MRFIAELRRRNVIRMAGLYLVGAWLVTQVAGTVLPMFGAPDWVARSVVILLALGFLPALAFAWVFELTPDGLKRDADVPTGQSIAPQTARRMDRAIIVVLAIAVVVFGVDRFVLAPLRGAATAPTAAAAPAPVPSAPVAQPRSIAVLPFVDMSQGKDQEYFSDGLSEQLLNALAQVPELHVAGRTSSFYFKGRNEDLREIGRKLNVATVLEGSVAKSGDTLRITAQLINAENGYHLWSQTYDRPFKDVFALQDEIAAKVVEALKLELLPGKAPATPRSQSAEGYDQYLLGLTYLRRNSVDGWNRAVEAFGRAVALDPGFAPAHAGLADAMYEVSYYHPEAAGVIAAQARALQSAETAIAVGPDQAEGYRARAKLRSETRFDQVGAMADLDRALQINPGDSACQQRIGDLFRYLGRFDEAQRALDKALDRDPLSVVALNSMAELHKQRGDFAQAERTYERALTLSPDSTYALEGLAETYLLQRRFARALATAQRQPDDARRLFVTAMIQHSLGDRAQSDRALDELARRFGAGWAYQVGAAYAWRGEPDAAFSWLDRAYAQQDGGLVLAKTDRLLVGLRSDPRYPALLRKVGMAP
jgi:serine/threonine-protein kinase